MTQFTDLVEEHRIRTEAEEWGNKIKFIHYNNGVEETKFNNGKSKFIDRETGKKWTVYPEDARLSLVERFERWLVDRRRGVVEE